jgi:hypothetical protein
VPASSASRTASAMLTAGTCFFTSTSASVSIRQHTSAYVSIRMLTAGTCNFSSTSAYVSIRQHTSAYVSIRHRRQQTYAHCRHLHLLFGRRHT